MIDKYIELLLNKCTNFEKSKSLFISYPKEHKEFVDKMVEKAKSMNVLDIYLNEYDLYYKHDLLKKIDIKDIPNHPLFNNPKWDEYAKKNASFIILDTEIPGLMDDIDSKKLGVVAKTSTKSKKVFKEKQLKNIIPWTIASLPNESWAKNIFPNSDNAYYELEEVIGKICMLDKEEPIKCWEKRIQDNNKIIEKLNNYKIKSLHYKNSLGTDLTVFLHEEAVFSGADAGGFIANMPSYEIFTTPIYNKTEGIVYSSKPLIYQGNKIDEFYLKFKEGKVIEYDARVGKNVLKEILEIDNNAKFLGEIALVNYDSPISNTGLVFGTTLFDENASCHLALGEGFSECIKNGNDLTKKELLEKGVNTSDTHVDFMIGTDDLDIAAVTYDDKEICIFKDGNFVKDFYN